MPNCIEIMCPEDARIKALVLETYFVQKRVVQIAFLRIFPVVARIPHDWPSCKENVVAVVKDNIVDRGA